jgi:hypothetical protein
VIGSSEFTTVFGAVPAGADEDDLALLATAAVRAGFAIVVDRPDTKIPLCTLSSAAANKADREARDQAAAAGRPHPERVRHACGINHALTEPEKVAATVRRLIKTHGRVNLGVAPGPSRMIVVDVDTEQELAAFWADVLIDAASSGEPRAAGCLTVQSPGQRGQNGEMAHSGGGHVWLTVPEGVELPHGQGKLKVTNDVGSYMIMWDGCQVLVPPSIRPEGVYRLVGPVQEAPAWLLDKIATETTARNERAAAAVDRAVDGDDPIERWSAETSWAGILTPDDWTDTGVVDGCSCPIWTAPGDHASPKSATAHEVGCDRYDTGTGWGPLHIWTDNPPPFLAGAGKTVTKLQYVAWRDHEGRMGAAMSALGLGDDGELVAAALDSWLPTAPVSPAPAGAVEVVEDASPAVNPFAAAGESAEEDEEAPEPAPWQTLMARWLSSAQMRELPPPEPLICGVVNRETIMRIIGRSNHGKTFVTLDMACSVATGRPWAGRQVRQGRVVYCIAEGARGFAERLQAWEIEHNGGEPIPPEQLLVIPFAVQVANAEEWKTLREALFHSEPELIVFDTQARISVGVKENDNTEMSAAYEQIDKIRTDPGNVVAGRTGPTVAVIHHLGHEGEQGRGASSVPAFIDTELRVEKSNDSIVTVHCAKQRDEEFFDPIEGRLHGVELDGERSSAVLTFQHSGQDDPFDTTAPAVDEHSQPYERVAAIAHEVFGEGHGATKSEIAAAVRERDRGRTGKPMARSTFYQAWADLESKDWLVQQLDGDGRALQRFKIKQELANRLTMRRHDGTEVQGLPSGAENDAGDSAAGAVPRAAVRDTPPGEGEGGPPGGS